jgi:hypothetical protein
MGNALRCFKGEDDDHGGRDHYPYYRPTFAQSTAAPPPTHHEPLGPHGLLTELVGTMPQRSAPQGGAGDAFVPSSRFQSTAKIPIFHAAIRPNPLGSHLPLPPSASSPDARSHHALLRHHQCTAAHPLSEGGGGRSSVVNSRRKAAGVHHAEFGKLPSSTRSAASLNGAKEESEDPVNNHLLANVGIRMTFVDPLKASVKKHVSVSPPSPLPDHAPPTSGVPKVRFASSPAVVSFHHEQPPYELGRTCCWLRPIRSNKCAGLKSIMKSSQCSGIDPPVCPAQDFPQLPLPEEEMCAPEDSSDQPWQVRRGDGGGKKGLHLSSPNNIWHLRNAGVYSGIDWWEDVSTA